MRKLIVDVSPILYGSLFSATNEVKKNGAKPNDKGKIPFDYKDIVLYKVLDELSDLKNQFKADEVILAFDNSANGGYWRKKYYNRYKYGRGKVRTESDIEWDKAFPVFEEMEKQLEMNSTFRVLSVPHMEADDIAFTLSEKFSNDGDTTILHTVDKDWEHNLALPNVELFKTRKTQKLPGIYVEKTEAELQEMREEHCISGDPGDGFLHIASWTQFSEEFLLEHPKFKGREIEMYEKHHEIESMYDQKHNWEKKAYKHKRFGYKSFKKSKKTLEDVLNENPIHRMNYERNQKLCLPDGVPQEYKTQILDAYGETKSSRKAKSLQEYFTNNGLFELIGKMTNF